MATCSFHSIKGYPAVKIGCGIFMCLIIDVKNLYASRRGMRLMMFL